MTEKQFQIEVIKYLKSINCWHVKIWGGGYQRSGIPDILACINGRFVALELKAESGQATALQTVNIRKIKESGGFAMVLYPKDFEFFKRYVWEVIKCNSVIQE